MRSYFKPLVSIPALLVLGRFIGLALGPERVNPVLANMFNLTASDPISPAPVPDAVTVTAQVLSTLSQKKVPEIFFSF